jgi:CDP-diacylglycerol--glycerol-3-phosphate 3-phosphatidyltransferase
LGKGRIVLSRLLRRWSGELMRPLVALLIRAGVTANQLTAAGLLAAIAAGALAAGSALPAAGIVLLVSGTLDALDGELARQRDEATAFGAFLDSVADHYGDLAIYLGIAWLMIAAGDTTLVMLTMIAMFGSVMGSHIRSRGGMMGLETKDVGLFTRAERIVVLVAGLLSGFVPAAMLVLAVANNVSALQRLAHLIALGHKRVSERDVAA